jgi:sugar lactone lactonase YvrE
MVEDFRTVIDERFELAEGPVWVRQSLWWVDIMQGTLHRWDPQSRTHETRHTGDLLGAAVPCTDGRWLLARNRSLVLFNWDLGRGDVVAQLEAEGERNRCNDGKCDPSGRFWFGTMNMDGAEQQAALYRFGAAGECRSMRDFSISNGLAWTEDGTMMYYIDSPRRRVDAFDFDDEMGRIANRRTLIEFEERDGWPDGMTIDSNECLWIAMWGGSKIVVVDSGSGRRISELAMPVSQPTSCTFGGDQLSDLFVTSAWEGMTPQQRKAEPLAGSLFHLRTDVTGRRVQSFDVDRWMC